MALRTPDAPESERSRIDEHYDDVLDPAAQARAQKVRDSLQNDPDSPYSEHNLQKSEENAGKASGGPGAGDSVRDREEKGGWDTNYNQPDQSQQKSGFNLKGIINKKSGPMALISGLLIGMLLFIFGTAPSMLLVHMSHILTDKFNTQEVTLDARYNKIFAKQLSGDALDGLCTQKVKVLCRYDGLSKRQVSLFEKGGVEIKESKDGLMGRKRPTLLVFEGKEMDPAQFKAELLKNPRLLAVARDVYNPRFATIADKLAAKVFSRFGTSRANPFRDGAKNDEERDKIVKDIVNDGDSGGGVNGKKYVKNDEGVWVEEGTDTPALNDDGTPVTDAQANTHNARIDAQGDLKTGVDGVVESGNKSGDDVLKEAESNLKGGGALSKVGAFFSVTSIADAGCSIHGAIQAVSYGSKVIRAIQMARYAMIFLSTASVIQAGDATPEDVTYLANILTKTVNEKTTNDAGEEVMTTTKAATDSYGFRYAAYGDSGPLTKSASLFLAGGGMGGKLGSTYNGIAKFLGGKDNIDDTCGVVKNPFVQAGSMIVGVIVTIFTGGVGKVVMEVGEGALTAVAMSAVGNVLMSYLQDLIAGILVDGDTFGENAGDAITSGTGAMLSSVAGVGGNAPLTPEEAVAFNGYHQQVLARYAEETRATHSPFDAMEQDTFMGQIVFQLLPFTSQMSSVSGLFTTSTDVVSRSLSTLLTPPAMAQTTADEYTQCQDLDYRGLGKNGVATDPFCNIVRGIPPHLLSSDPVEVAQRLINDGHIDEGTGAPKSDEYKDFVKNCIDRESPLGYTGEESQGSSGEECFIGNEDGTDKELERLEADFYLFRMDTRVLDGMEEGYDEGDCGVTGANATPAAGMADAATIDALIEKSEGGTPGPMHGMGATIIELSNKYGLNSNFIVATFKAETQFGTDGSAGAQYNNFGWNAENGDGDCPSIPLTINGTVRMYNCYSTPEKGIEGALKNITTNPAYKEVPPEAPPGSKEGSVAAVRNVYCPEGDGPAGDPASQCNLERFIQGSITDGIPLDKDDPVFLSSSGASGSGSSTGSSGSTAKISDSEVKALIEEYGLPEPEKSGENGYDALLKGLQENPDAKWAAQSFLAGEKYAKGKGMDIKEYLTTAWVWFETGPWPDPYEMNCLNDTEGTEATYVCPSSASGDLQVAGYQASDVRDKFQEVYNKLYTEGELTSVMEKVVQNSNKASKEIWNYYDPSNKVDLASIGSISNITLQDLWPNKEFSDKKAHIASLILGKDPNMAAALNSFAVSEDDVIKHISGPGCGPGWASYICDDDKQRISNMIMALYMLDDGSVGASGCSAPSSALGTGVSVIWGGEGERNLDYGFGSDAGLNLYEYGIGMGLGGTGTKHTGLDIPDEPEAPIYSPVDGIVTCEGTNKGAGADGAGCGAFNDYMGQGNGRIEIQRSNGDVIILGHTSTSLVKEGDTVKVGQQVGTVGGMNGYHTHLEVRTKNEEGAWILVDPIEYFGGI